MIAMKIMTFKVLSILSLLKKTRCAGRARVNLPHIVDFVDIKINLNQYHPNKLSTVLTEPISTTLVTSVKYATFCIENFANKNIKFVWQLSEKMSLSKI
jgi:hypothetical protein